MKVRRTAFVVSAVVVLTGVALGAGVALGSGALKAGGAPSDEGGASATSPSRATGVKCKSQACVHFLTDGTITGYVKKVESVNHLSTGLYCVVLKSNLHVDDFTGANLTIDYLQSGNVPGVVVESDSHDCTSSGFPNSIRVRTFDMTGALADFSVWLTVP